MEKENQKEKKTNKIFGSRRMKKSDSSISISSNKSGDNSRRKKGKLNIYHKNSSAKSIENTKENKPQSMSHYDHDDCCGLDCYFFYYDTNYYT